ncbi:hypothetical protein Tco_1156826 [Tanacetum coccineum]
MGEIVNVQLSCRDVTVLSAEEQLWNSFERSDSSLLWSCDNSSSELLMIQKVIIVEEAESIRHDTTILRCRPIPILLVIDLGFGVATSFAVLCVINSRRHHTRILNSAYCFLLLVSFHY